MKNNNKGMLRHQAVYLDSPMAIAVTESYHRYQNVYNAEDAAMLNQVKAGSLHTFLPVLRYSTSTEESMALKGRCRRHHHSRQRYVHR